MKTKLKQLAQASVLLTTLIASTQASASLIVRDGGMVYDDVLDITWLLDANYAKTSGYAADNQNGSANSTSTNIQADGRMGWDAAITWSEQLVYAGFDDWRLPTLQPLSCAGQTNCTDDFNYPFAYDGSRDHGSNITSPMSELAYMFNVNLALPGQCDPVLSTADTCVTNDAWTRYYQQNIPASFIDAATGDTVEVDNLMGERYWYDLEYKNNIGVSSWVFGMYDGSQGHNGKSNSMYAWAVRDGDVANSAGSEVPEPGSLALFGLVMLGLGARRFTSASN
ncbi:PEP-CTERM sorting domain-containing protein [Thalassomonas sp. RHCl1]|uniref:PEP-CTERM sorting domain-containing protein n=1 Tax=Thalassomonas sp. RHCl1 TaxID=2995320 RepID=UPI00248C63B1|nr:PEP-CTERM sorting domain-containing protein [Thalassomonas sp. RHCl1]